MLLRLVLNLFWRRDHSDTDEFFRKQRLEASCLKLTEVMASDPLLSTPCKADRGKELWMSGPPYKISKLTMDPFYIWMCRAREPESGLVSPTLNLMWWVYSLIGLQVKLTISSSGRV